MCTYNGAAFIAAQLESILQQTRVPDELVICDDGSTDETLEIIEDFARRAPFPIRIRCNSQNLRVIKNFEQAISLCQGEIIALCDQDDVWMPEKLAVFEREFARDSDVGLVFCDLEAVDEDLQPLGFTAWESGFVMFERKEQDLFKQGKALDVLLTRNIVTGAAVAFRAEYQDLITPFPEVSKYLLHDYWMVLLISTAARIALVPQPLVKYRIHTNQQACLLMPIPDVAPLIRTRIKRKRFHPNWENLERVAARLAERAEHNPRYAKALAALQPRLQHARIRSGFSQHRFHKRLLLALKEYVAHRYALYRRPDAGAWYEFLNDVLPYKIQPLREAVSERRTPKVEYILANKKK